MIMDFTTTAVARHAVFDRTLASFSKNLKGVDMKECRLVVNVDPLPAKGDRQAVVDVAKKYFKEVKYNFPSKANFTAAYNWILSNAETEYIFNLEDDWELFVPINVNKIINCFKDKNMLQVLLRAYRYHYRTCALSPGIWHRRFYSAVGGNLKTDLNPEAQLRGERFGIVMPTSGGKKGGISYKGRIAVFPQGVRQVVLKDLGRKWINKSPYKKSGAGKKAHFITWERK